MSRLDRAERLQIVNVMTENKDVGEPPPPRRKCVVIVDLWNLRGWLTNSKLAEEFTYSGIKRLLELFAMTPDLLHVVGPVMQLQHGSVNVRVDPRARKLKQSREHIKKIVEEAHAAGVETPPTPPGGLWEGEVGVDAIVALLALHYCSSSEYHEHETVVLSSDKDFWGLHYRTKFPTIIGNFDTHDRRAIKESFPRQRFISAQGLEQVIAGREPVWRPFFNDGCWKRPNAQNPNESTTISSDSGNANEEVVQGMSEHAGTTCIVDPYGLIQFGMRQLSIAKLPSTETMNHLLVELGFPQPYRSDWTIPNVKVDDNVDDLLRESFKEQDGDYDKLARTLRRDHDDLTNSKRATQRVSSAFADRVIFEFGHERLLNHRWMKHLTTNLINDVWAAVQSLKSKGTDHVVVIGGNLELEHCLRVCSAFGPRAIRDSLRCITYVFAEPPTLREFLTRDPLPHFEWFTDLYKDKDAGGRGQHGYVTLSDSQLARLLRVDHDFFGRRLRLPLLGEHTESGPVDPDTAIKRVDAGGNIKHLPSGERLGAKIKIRLNDHECEVFGVRRGPHSSDRVRWVAHFSTSDDALAPVLLPEGETVAGRNKVQGNPIEATALNRTARVLRVRLPGIGAQENERDIVVGDLPHILKSGDKITVGQTDERGEKFVVIDIPHSHTKSNPISVMISGGTTPKWTVHPVNSDDSKGTLVSYTLPFDSPPFKIGDRLLAMEIFNDPNAATESERRIYLALSSALPATRSGLSGKRSADGEFSTTSVTYRDVTDE